MVADRLPNLHVIVEPEVWDNFIFFPWQWDLGAEQQAIALRDEYPFDQPRIAAVRSRSSSTTPTAMRLSRSSEATASPNWCWLPSFVRTSSRLQKLRRPTAALRVSGAPALSKIVYTIPEAVAASGLTRTALYGLIRAGQLPRAKVGKRTLIRSADLQKLIDDRLIN
jgi:predicted DNA-binding transcriptional regulator AlpA